MALGRARERPLAGVVAAAAQVVDAFECLAVEANAPMRLVDVDPLVGAAIDPADLAASAADGAFVVEIGRPVRLDACCGHVRAGRQVERAGGQLPGGQRVPVAQHQVVMAGAVSGVLVNDKGN